MKRLRNVIYHFSLNQMNLKLCIFGSITALIMIVFYSCSTEDASVNKPGNTTTKKQSEKTKSLDKLGIIISDNTEENVISFSEEIFTNFGSLDVALNKNSKVNFNANTMQMLNSATNENDLKNVFANAGISNTQEIITILKNIVETQQAFILQNPDFYNLTIEEQTILLNASVEVYINSNPPGGLVGSNNCARTFNKTINRCASDFGVCAVFAVAGAYGGIVPGLLGAAYCMATKLSCDGRAKEDYRECLVEPVSPDGPPPVTGELTIHCTDRWSSTVDSCWTTDSNGKYVGRIN
ncbi:hypothetical protein IRZ71_05085 [Flavobacterium sp. ANB]|uniref:hypothetical protein n=1 Tax=unclassified Flavobacterium TaxID=196869 RepID=UPI0012B71037|nr:MULTISPECIES: hypothetical protein [unclassified Flavobacterium]MBF4515702.1 hypothetical protein [Flavobacterium sp. ANB]MTD68705.1 hypothetical protein [Flavobacterium sp. LC2016-13]